MVPSTTPVSRHIPFHPLFFIARAGREFAHTRRFFIIFHWATNLKANPRHYRRFEKIRSVQEEKKRKKSENEKRFERKNFRRGIKLPLWEHGGAWRQGSSDFYRDDPGGNNASYHQLLHVPPRTPTRAPSLRMHTRNAGIARVLHGFREGRWEFNKLRRVFRPRLLSFRAVAARRRDTERRIFVSEDAPTMVDSLG